MAAFNPSSFTETEAMFHTEKFTNVARFNDYWFGGWHSYLIATATTTVVEVRGLTRAEADAYAISADYNYKDLHGVRFTSSGGAQTWAPSCEGAECKAIAKRINDADMWRVVITHISTVVTHNGNWTKTTF